MKNGINLICFDDDRHLVQTFGFEREMQINKAEGRCKALQKSRKYSFRKNIIA